MSNNLASSYLQHLHMSQISKACIRGGFKLMLCYNKLFTQNTVQLLIFFINTVYAFRFTLILNSCFQEHSLTSVVNGRYIIYFGRHNKIILPQFQTLLLDSFNIFFSHSYVNIEFIVTVN
jgi:hypothetical protein